MGNIESISYSNKELLDNNDVYKNDYSSYEDGLLKGSQDYLLKKIDEFTSNDNELQEYEALYIVKQLKNHEILKEVYDLFQENKCNIKSDVRMQISKELNFYQGQFLSNMHLSRFKEIISVGLSNTNGNKSNVKCDNGGDSLVSNFENKEDNKLEVEVSKGDKILKKELLQRVLSNTHNVNYLEFINENGLSPEVKKIILHFRYKFGFKEKKEEKIFSGFLLFLKIFASMESDGENIKNNKGSSAEGYFQYLTGNGKNGYELLIDGIFVEVSEKKFNQLKKAKSKFYKGKKITKFNIRHKKSSYELALYEVNKYYGNNKPAWLNGDIKSPMNLNSEQQTVLFLIDLFTKTKKVFNKKYGLRGINDFLPLAIDGNEWGIKKIYYIFHHTNPDESTKKRIREKINLYRTSMMALNKK